MDFVQDIAHAYILNDLFQQCAEINSLDAQEAVSFIKEALAYSGIRKLDVVIEDKEDCEVETIDLLSNVAKYVLPFNYSMSNPITHERLYFNLKSEIIKDEK